MIGDLFRSQRRYSCKAVPPGGHFADVGVEGSGTHAKPYHLVDILPMLGLRVQGLREPR